MADSPSVLLEALISKTGLFDIVSTTLLWGFGLSMRDSWRKDMFAINRRGLLLRGM